MLELPLYFGAEPPVLLFETLEGVERDLVGVTPGIAGENVLVRPMPGGSVDVLGRGSTRGESVIVHAGFYGRRGRGARVFVPNAVIPHTNDVIRTLALSETRGSEGSAGSWPVP